MVQVQYAKSAVKDLKKIEKKVALRIVKKVKENAEMKNPLARAKALTGILTGLYRYRIGDYRVIFEMRDGETISILLVLSVQHRKDIYR